MAAVHVASAAISRRLQNGGHNHTSNNVCGQSDSEDRIKTCKRAASGSPPSPPTMNRFVPTSASTPTRRMRPSHAYCFNSNETTDSESTNGSTSSSGASPPPHETYDNVRNEVNSIEPPKFRAPILGYEIMEQRAKFTVFKIHVQHIPSSEGWFVFRRYTDFVRLNRRLRGLFPTLRFGLPPKRWFRDNFEQSFLDERLRGLQTFVDNVLSFSGSSKSIPVQDFFCFDDPPGPHDSIEESRARCETLEELVSSLRIELCEKQVEVDILRAELALTKAQKETLKKSLRIENGISDIDTTILTPADDRCAANETTQLYCTALEDREDSTIVEIHDTVENPLDDAAKQNGESILHDRDVRVETRQKQAPFSMDSNGNQMVESNGVVLDVRT